MFALAVRGKPRSGVEERAPSPFPPFAALRASGEKPSPTRGEGKNRALLRARLGFSSTQKLASNC
jgi:hypothetical protein